LSCERHDDTGRCISCRGEGTHCDCKLGEVCPHDACVACEGDGMCRDCIAFNDKEEKYWRAYFGAEIKNAAIQARFEREDYGRELTDEERLYEARRLK
jgi:hypothetical protein